MEFRNSSGSWIIYQIVITCVVSMEAKSCVQLNLVGLKGDLILDRAKNKQMNIK